MKLHYLLPAIAFAATGTLAAYAATPAAHTFNAAANGNAVIAAPRTAAIADGDNANCFEITSDNTCSLFNLVPFIGDDGVLRIPATAIIDGHTYTVNALDIFSEGAPLRPFPEKEAFVRGYEFPEEGIEFSVTDIVEPIDDSASRIITDQDDASGSVLPDLTIDDDLLIGDDGFIIESIPFDEIDEQGIEFSVLDIVEAEDDDAYRLCTSVTAIEFPATIEHINLFCLEDFPHVAAYRVDPANATFYSLDGALYTKRSHTLAACPREFEGQFVIPEGVEAIGEEAFSYCEALTAINIPASVTTIGRRAFFDCLSLTTVSLPKGLKVIDDEAFADCYALTSISIPESVTHVGASAFYGCEALNDFTYPKHLEADYNSWFEW